MTEPRATIAARTGYGLTLVDGREQLVAVEDGEARIVVTAAADAVDASVRGAGHAHGHPLRAQPFLAPVKPSKVIGVGLNYLEHAVEAVLPLPELPQLFAKWPTAVGPPDGEVELVSPETDYEVELGIVIGKTCSDVALEHALDVVAGYVVVNDLSARDRQFADGQYVLGKSYDGYCPCGPVIVPVDELGDASDLRLQTRLNGELVQDSTTADMIFGVRQIVSYCTCGVTLRPGDLIITGTPQGVGFTREPPRFLREGDVVEVSVEGIGSVVTRFRTSRLDAVQQHIAGIAASRRAVAA